MEQPYDTVRELLDEQRELRAEYSELRVALATLVGYHDRDGVIPVAKIAALLDGETNE